jgi:hypothetical protein
MHPRWMPATKTNWPNDRQSQKNYNFTSSVVVRLQIIGRRHEWQVSAVPEHLQKSQYLCFAV